MPATETIDQTTFERLVEAGAVRGADVVGRSGGWGVVVKYGMVERPLAARRGSMRTWRRFETLVSYLKKVGFSQYTVNAADYDPGAAPAYTRPDASARMRAALDAKAHDDWIRAKVAKSLADPRPSIPHEQVMAEMRAIIEAKRKQHASKKTAA